MKVIYNTEKYDPAPDMLRMIYNVARSMTPTKIEYFVMDENTYRNLRIACHNDVYLRAPFGEVSTYCGIPIATLRTNGEIKQQFVSAVHGIKEMSYDNQQRY